MAYGIFRLSTGDEDRRVADLWIAEFGDAAGWHIARKVADLAAWGDPAGAAALKRVQKLIARADNAYTAGARVERLLRRFRPSHDGAWLRTFPK